ncbi:transglutaminase domain-containing protein [Marispirochaeta aestuarii]|uniref:transglutaminase domain-containing protein n=1 Tax=Marispirochaeta aestuarii TaxID=1963862 RepID=UPI0029C6EA34|nr:transglutaminase domain-containing protein [Marispirochaeta aestuarii]
MAVFTPLKNLLKDQRSLPVLFLLLLVGLYVFSSQMIEQSPRIESITPEVGAPGKVLVISGEHFGTERNGAEVIFAGTRPNSTSYVEWTENRISVRIPEDVGSGKLYVRIGNKTSNSVLFTNSRHIPKQLSGPAAPGMPYIASLDNPGGPIGSVVSIRGLNFGSEQGSGRVYFSSTIAQNDQGREVIDRGIICSLADFDYESWEDQTIEVRVPDNATSGSIRVLTDRGVSNALYFEVTDLAGDRILREKRGYQINYTVEIEEADASPGNSLNLWVPNVMKSPTQDNLEAVRDPIPLWEDYNGVARYRLQELEPWRRYTVSVTYWLDRTALETRIVPSRINSEYDRDWRLYRVYTSPDSYVPSATRELETLSARAIGRESNPYLKARNIFRVITRDFAPSAAGNDTVSLFLENRQGDSFDYARLYTAMLRASGVPARIISGCYIFGDSTTSFHYWVEFYVPGFGWVPSDPFIGDGGYGEEPEVDDPQEYYFANVDNRRIAFSRGIIELRPTDPGSRLNVKSRIYSLQTIHEEAVGNISSYQSRWFPVRVIDRW